MAVGSKKKKNGKTGLAEEQKLILTENSPWPEQEAYKALRTNLIFSLPGKECKVIGVTSAFRGDGKSLNALNLAISFAQVGKKTMLIEGDLRLPTISKRLGCKSIPGLSDILAGEAAMADGMWILENHSDLSFIPAGNRAPDPTWLYQSRQMADLIRELRGQYEYVIIDLPPVTMVSDAQILSPLIDGYVLVVRDGTTEYRAIGDTLSQLKFAHGKVLGFIYNDAGGTGGGYYKRGYYKHGYYKNGYYQSKEQE